MEDVLFHATLISEITDHSKFMDRDFIYEAFKTWCGFVVGNVVVAAVVICLLCLLFFAFLFFVFCCFFAFLSNSQIDNAKQWSFALIINTSSFLLLICQLYSFYGLTD